MGPLAIQTAKMKLHFLTLFLTSMCQAQQHFLIETKEIARSRPRVGRADVAAAPAAPAAPKAEAAAPEAPPAEAPAAEGAAPVAAAETEAENPLLAEYKTFLSTIKDRLQKGEPIPDAEYVAFGKLVEAAVKANPDILKVTAEIKLNGAESEAPAAPDAAATPDAAAAPAAEAAVPDAAAVPAAPA